MDNASLPHIIVVKSAHNPPQWVKENTGPINAALDADGAVLIRGLDVRDAATFKEVVSVFSADSLPYVYRSTPRTAVEDRIFTATEYSPGMAIPLHNENSFQRDWPLKLLFYCEYPADGGGQTPLAYNVNVTRRIDSEVRKRFEGKGITYVRNYRPGIDLPWQTVFQTESKEEVERYCLAHDISLEWIAPDHLRTWQTCQVVAQHPRKNNVVWFNQAHLFHPSSLDPQTRGVMKSMFKEEDFPRNAVHADGTPIGEADLDHIREAFESETVLFQWQAGDILILDNMLVAHGRRPYKGRRRVLTAMCESYRQALGDNASRLA